MHRHKLGDRVRINRPDDWDHGVECSITGCDVVGYAHPDLKPYVGYEVDTPHDEKCPVHCGGHVYEGHELIPIYDGNDTVAWEDCIWQPNKVTG